MFQGSWTPVEPISLAGLIVETGALGQAPTTTWASAYPSFALAYSGIAYLVGVAFDLGPSATLGTNQCVVQGLRYSTGSNGVDADPALVISDFLSSTQYGVGFTATITGLTGTSGDSSLQSYCHATGLCFSPILADREAANSILDRWLQLLNCTCVWSSGELRFIPRGDTAITANGWTFTPDLTVQYALNDDSYAVAKGESDPVQVVRSDPYDIDNYVIVEITSRGDNFNTGPIPVFDQQAIDRYGLKVGSSISAHEICDPLVAQTAAQLILQRGLYIRRTFKLTLSWEYSLLDPMDFISISDSRIGLNATIVRIQEIEEDEDGMLAVTAEEFPIGAATAAPYAIQAPSNGTPNSQVTPNSVNTPLIFEPPPVLSGGQVQIWAAASPINGDPNWGGAVPNISFDGTSYQPLPAMDGRSIQGVLLANLATYSGANPDTTNTLSVNLAESGGALLSTTAANAAAGATVCLVDSEYIGYETATLITADEYNLTTLYRGMFGSAPAAHSTGASFAYLTAPLFKFTLPSNQIGKELWLKFQSFNAFGAQLQSLASCAAYTYGITGGGYSGPSLSYYTSAWTCVGGSANPVVGNGFFTAAYGVSGVGGSTITNAVSITFGSTTTLGTGGHWAFAAIAAAGGAGSGTYTIGAPVNAAGTANIASGASVITLTDPTLGAVGPTTYTIPAGAILTVELTYPS
jgi:hypothetical protein